MFCHKCGAQVSEGAIFCHKCGTKVVHENDTEQAGPQQEASLPSQFGEWRKNCSTEPPKSTTSTPNSKKPGKPVGLIAAAVIALIVVVIMIIPKTNDPDFDDDDYGFSHDSEDFADHDVYLPFDNDDDYYDDDWLAEEEGDVPDSVIDPSLVGRWRSYDGGALEFDSYGYIVETDIQLWTALGGKPDYIMWSALNGRVTCDAYHTYEFPYTFTYQTYNNTEYLSLSGTEYQRVSGTEGSGLYGAWERDLSGVHFGFQFSPTGGGSYYRRVVDDVTSYFLSDQECWLSWYTYTASDGQNMLCYTTQDITYFDYTVSGNILTVFLSDSSRVYTRIGY